MRVRIDSPKVRVLVALGTGLAVSLGAGVAVSVGVWLGSRVKVADGSGVTVGGCGVSVSATGLLLTSKLEAAAGLEQELNTKRMSRKKSVIFREIIMSLDTQMIWLIPP